MNPKIVGLGLALSFLSSTFSVAQTVTPQTAWQCKADCFGFEGRDGASLRYWGGVRTGLFFDQAEAYRQLKNSCGDNGILVVRKLKGTVTQTTTADVYENDSSVTERQTWYGLQIISTSSRSKRYQVLDHDLRAIFDVQEATPGNACESQSIYSHPIWATPTGDPVKG